MKLKTWMGLVVCNLIWAAHPLMGKILLEEFSPSQTAWLRYFSAFLFYAFLTAFRSKQSLFVWPDRTQDRGLLLLLAFMAFSYTPLLQMVGLGGSLATENSIIIAMEPLITVGMAWIILGESLSSFDVMGLSLALLGFVFLSGVTGQSFVVGNLWLLLSMLGEACFSVLGKKLTRKYSPGSIFGTALGVGVLILTVTLSAGGHLNSLFTWSHFTKRVIFALCWIGPLGTGATYLFALTALAEISVFNMAVLLFLQPVVGTALGFFLLGERMTALQSFGSGLILLAVLLPSALRLKKWSIH